MQFPQQPGQLRILLVEDDRSQLLLLAKFLRRENFDVTTCSGLTEASDAILDNEFAVAIVDLDLNGESGLELARLLQRRKIPTRVVIHTAHSSFQSVREGLDLGIFAYVEKYADFSQLIESVHRAASHFLNEHLNAANESIVVQLKLLDAVDQGIVATDLAGNLIFWNLYASRITTVEPHDAIGKSIHAFFHFSHPAKQLITQAINNGDPWRGEGEVIMPRSARDLLAAAPTCPVHLVVSPLLDSRGQMVGAALSFRDIRIEKENATSLAHRAKLLAISADLGRSAVEVSDRETFYSTLLAKMSAGIDIICGKIEMQVSGRNQFITAAVYGCDEEDNCFRRGFAPLRVKSLNFAKVEFAPLDGGDVLTADQVSPPGHPVVSFRVAFREDSKTAGVVECVFRSPQMVSVDEIVFIQSSISLLTGVLQRDRANRLWKSLFDNASEAVLLSDDLGRYVNMNSAACEMFGYSFKDLKHKSLSDLTGGESIFERCGEMQFVRKDNTKITAEIETIKNILPGIHLSILRDVTKRKQDDNRISEQNDQLLHVQRLATVGNLAATLAHEINQPLGTISLLSGGLMLGLRENDPAATETREMLSMINREALKAGYIVNRLRKFISLNPFQLAAININDIVHETMKVLHQYCENSGARIFVDLQDHLPLLNADAIRMEQVFVNLIRNAIEAMVEIRAEDRVIRIITRSNASHIEMVISDNGPRLDDDAFGQLLQPYHSTKPEGLGMGLYISRSIVEQHNGTLEMIRLLPNGLAGSIRLPIADEIVP